MTPPTTPTSTSDSGTANDPRDYDSLQEGLRPPRTELSTAGTLREIATQLAEADAATTKYTDPYLAEHGAGLVAEDRLFQLSYAFARALDAGRRDALAWGRHLVRIPIADLKATDTCLERAREQLAAAESRRDGERDIVDGRVRGPHQGDWEDPGATEILATTSVAEFDRATSRARRLRTVRNLCLGGAEVVMLFVLLQPVSDLTLGFVPAQVNDVLVLIPALLICTATIWLAHKIGETVKNTIRVPGLRGVGYAQAAAMTALLLGIQLAASYLRVLGTEDATANLYLWLWLCVMVAISAIAAGYSVKEYNPSREQLRHAHRAVLERTAEVDRLSAQREKLLTVIAEREASLTDVDAQWLAAIEAAEDEWEHLVAIYRDTLARALADPSITTALEVAPVVRPAGPQARITAAANGALQAVPR